MRRAFTKMTMIVALTALISSCGKNGGEITIKLPKNFSDNTVVVSHILIDNMCTAGSADDVRVMYDTLTVFNGMATMRVDDAGPARYEVEPPVMTRQTPEFYAAPGESLEVEIIAFEPLDYRVSGTELMEDMTALSAITNPISQEYVTLMSTREDVTPEEAGAIMDRYDAAIKKFAADHPDSPIVPYAIMELSGDDFKAIYDNLTDAAKKSILMPFAEQYNESVMDMVKERDAEQARKAEVASGTIPAPGFTLPDLSGKKVSLSDFKGKWVVLDFWGSWCGWCVKGFPALKEAYHRFGDKIVVIGIDCNESEADWRAGVKQHDIPWLNLYNGNDRALYEAYGIEGFPTKAIINPDGKLVDLTTGEDPSFYDRLDDFLTK